MKRQTKRLWAFLCALLLTLQLCPIPANSVLSGVYMISVDDDLMPVDANTMPFWSGGRLYVPYTVFRGIYGTSLGISYTVTVDQKIAVLHTRQKALLFDLETGKVEDDQKNRYYISATKHNGEMFFPLDLVCDFFGLTYTYSQTDIVPLIRIKSDAVILSDTRFIDAARSLMWQYYNQYEKAVEESRPPVETPEGPVVYTGQWIYLVFTVTDAAPAKMLANTLSRRDMQATFLLTPEQMEAEGDLLRALVGMGHGIGILPEAESAGDVAAKLEQANAALWKATHSRTRMVWLGEDAAAMRKELEELGYCAVDCRVDASETPLGTSARAEALYKRLSAIAGGTVTVFLGDDSRSTAGLDRLLTQLSEADSRVLAWRETL